MSLRDELLRTSKQAEKEIIENTTKSLFDSLVSIMKSNAKQGRQSCTINFSPEFEKGGFFYDLFEIYKAKCLCKRTFNGHSENIIEIVSTIPEIFLRSAISKVFLEYDELYGILTCVNGSNVGLDWGSDY